MMSDIRSGKTRSASRTVASEALICLSRCAGTDYLFYISDDHCFRYYSTLISTGDNESGDLTSMGNGKMSSDDM